jgi:hypothetical protein
MSNELSQRLTALVRRWRERADIERDMAALQGPSACPCCTGAIPSVQREIHLSRASAYEAAARDAEQAMKAAREAEEP